MKITDRKLIDDIIRGSLVCRLGLARRNEPYLVPVSFGYDGKAIYFHGARRGRKIDFLEANDRVCVEFERGVRVVPDDGDPCKWSFAYESVIGRGRAEELRTIGEKIEALAHIMRHYSDREWNFDERAVAAVRVWRILLESVTAKRSEG